MKERTERKNCEGNREKEKRAEKREQAMEKTDKINRGRNIGSQDSFNDW